jgi:hypothetical protein
MNDDVDDLLKKSREKSQLINKRIHLTKKLIGIIIVILALSIAALSFIGLTQSLDTDVILMLIGAILSISIIYLLFYEIVLKKKTTNINSRIIYSIVIIITIATIMILSKYAYK